MQNEPWQESDADVSAWTFGIAAPIVLALFSVQYCLTQTAVITSRGGSFTLHGRDAIALGLFPFFAGAFLHFRFWWGVRRDALGESVSEWGKALSLVALSISGLLVAWITLSLYWR